MDAGDTTCEACGAELIVVTYLNAAGEADFALICPDCDRVSLDDDPITPYVDNDR